MSKRRVHEQEVLQMVDGVEVPCPCGGKARLGLLATGEYAALHSLPACEAYRVLEVSEYATALRQALQKTGS